MNETNSPLSLLPRRPHVTEKQAVVMATRLFNLNIADHFSVKELDSYEDRNFYLRGSLNETQNNLASFAGNEYVLKIANHIDSNHEHLMQTQCDVMSFLQARGHKCSSPVPSIFGTSFVMCKIPSDSAPDGVALATDHASDVCNLEKFEIYNGEAYSKEDYFICAVRLQTFVPGKMLNEVPHTNQLFFHAGKTLGRLDQHLKVPFFKVLNEYHMVL